MDDGGRPERHPDLIPRLRQITMILVFDLGGPLLAYSLLRSAGMSAVASLVISGVLPALGIGISALADRRVDVIGIVVLAGLLAGTLLGLTSHNARLYLLEGSVLLQADPLRVRRGLVRLDARLRRAREEEGRTPRHRQRRRRSMTACRYTLVRCLAR
ncbi:MAG TPA: hypothetical protein VHS30_30210 [Streptosporangiaceae bacterium]|nr:hypothetical protein [Streptosporangiaceae bacterium]